MQIEYNDIPVVFPRGEFYNIKRGHSGQTCFHVLINWGYVPRRLGTINKRHDFQKLNSSFNHLFYKKKNKCLLCEYYTNVCSWCQGNVVLYFILTGTPIRTKYRMTLKNNVKPIIAADALLYSLFYQLIFFLITHRFKVFKEATDVIIDYVFCLFF